MTDYRIDISCGDDMLTIAPDSPLRLLAGGLYGFDTYTSMDVYRAVLEQGVRSAEELLANDVNEENRI